MRSAGTKSTRSADYATYLVERDARWKRVVDVQRPYRLHVRALKLGSTLDVGCGIGRNLAHLAGAGLAVGVDHNPDSVAVARSRGLLAFTPDEFRASEHSRQAFESLLCAHVLEHLSADDALALLREYLPRVKPGGRVVLITPQEAGYRSDATHVTFMDFERLRALFERLELELLKEYSFPFPRLAGRVFKYNEFVAIGRKSA